jgi:hypothetical protein
MAASLVPTDPIRESDSDSPISLLLVKAKNVRRGDYVRWEYGWERVLKVGGERVGTDFIYLFFGRERIGYEYWDCYKTGPDSLITIGREL